MYLIYIDDSRDQDICVFSAIAIPEDSWKHALDTMRDYRRSLRQRFGIYVYKELHAWKFVSGRGKISDRVVTKYHRCQIFEETLRTLAELEGIKLFNAVFPSGQDTMAFEWLANRINRTLQAWGNRGLLVCDEGNEAMFTRLIRRMRVYNPIPSRFATWDETGRSHKNIPLERIIEDPWFKDSRMSYFIQLADFCAYALLCKENPKYSRTRHGLNKAFDILSPLLVREATQYDPDGIIRPTR